MRLGQRLWRGKIGAHLPEIPAVGVRASESRIGEEDPDPPDPHGGETSCDGCERTRSRAQGRPVGPAWRCQQAMEWAIVERRKEEMGRAGGMVRWAG
jgi:hypothetical protein